MKEITKQWQSPSLTIKITTFFFLVSFFFLLFFFSPPFTSPFHISQNALNPTFPSSPNAPFPTFPPPPPPRHPVVETMGIVDSNGVMSDSFKVGDFEAKFVDKVIVNVTIKEDEKKESGVMVEKYEICDVKMVDFIPCLDYNLSDKDVKFERHCPEKGNESNCLVPVPTGYRTPIPWPRSRDEVWYSNVPHTRLVDDKGGQNWISIKGDKFIFPGGGTQFIHGADQYLDQISQMVPDIKFGQNMRVGLDIGCGVASFGAFLVQHNVTVLSVAPKDVHENQIQFALERGVPAMVAAFGTRRLLYPSQAFDFVHCSRCRINWTRDDGTLLLEVNRMLRAGGYFIWAAQPVYKHEKALQEQWKEMENITSCICWELVKKEGYIAIWRKPINNSCYLNREVGARLPLCDPSDDPDNVWYVDLNACITKIPDNGYGANVSTWPERLHNSPDRLQSIQMDAYISRKEIYKAESKYWKDIIESYVRAFHWKGKMLRNVMDMRAGYGGFAAALHDVEIDCWVMNVVPVSGYNTLPVIFDRGLVGVMHDWCEPFDTYPRTYDLLHAAGLFSIERKRCNLSSIMLEMDRILRPNGLVYIRDSITVIDELEKIGSAMRWVCLRFDTGEGPHASWKILRCDKRR